MNSLISVIIPIYNGEDYIESCLDSVLDQTYKNIEILLIDDGSEDSTASLCDRYASIYGNIKSFHISNSGPSVARNEGIKKATGEFIFFLDADDYLAPNSLEDLYKKALEHNSSFVIGDFKKCINGEKISSGHAEVFSQDEILDKEAIVKYTVRYLDAPNKNPLFTQAWGRLFKRSIILNNNIWFNPNLRTFEDIDFNFKYLRYVDELLFVNFPYYFLRIHGDNLSATMNTLGGPEVLFGYREALEEIYSFLILNNAGREASIFISKAFVTYSIIQIIRVSIQVNKYNKRKVENFVKKLLKDPFLKKGLPLYSRRPTDSRLIPFLMKRQWAKLLLFASRRRGLVRYKNEAK